MKQTHHHHMQWPPLVVLAWGVVSLKILPLREKSTIVLKNTCDVSYICSKLINGEENCEVNFTTGFS